jgi:hypothetical protein
MQWAAESLAVAVNSHADLGYIQIDKTVRIHACQQMATCGLRFRQSFEFFKMCVIFCCASVTDNATRLGNRALTEKSIESCKVAAQQRVKTTRKQPLRCALSMPFTSEVLDVLNVPCS